MWPLDNSNANQSAIDASHSSPRRESSSSPRLDRFLLEVGKWGSAGGSSLSVSEDRFQSERNIVRFRTKFDSRRFFFFFFPTLGDPLLSLCIESGVAIFFFFFFFGSRFYSEYRERDNPLSNRKILVVSLSFFFFLRLDVSEYFVK